MTEQEWLASDNPAAMLRKIVRDGTPRRRSEPGGKADWASDRKLRLFACACCRSVWRLLADERSRKGVEVAEQFADGEATDIALAVARSFAAEARNWGHEKDAHMSAWLAHVCTATEGASIVEVTRRQTELAVLVPPAGQAALLREIVGNPFRPAYVVHKSGSELAFEPEVTRRTGRRCVSIGMVGHCVLVDRDWLTPTVRSLAQAAYDERLTGGTLDPVRLMVLADALEEAGCTDESVLSHLRSGGPHVRGCWVLDLILGRD